jgi:hypothetical protein
MRTKKIQPGGIGVLVFNFLENQWHIAASHDDSANNTYPINRSI